MIIVLTHLANSAGFQGACLMLCTVSSCALTKDVTDIVHCIVARWLLGICRLPPGLTTKPFQFAHTHCLSAHVILTINSYHLIINGVNCLGFVRQIVCSSEVVAQFLYEISFMLWMVKSRFVFQTVSCNLVLSGLRQVCLSVRPHGTTRLPLNRFHEIWYSNVFRKCLEKLQVWLKSDNNNGYFTWKPMYIYDNISLNFS